MIIGKSREDSDLNDFLDVGRFLVAVLPLTGHGNFGSSAVFFFFIEITGNLKAKGSLSTVYRGNSLSILGAQTMVPFSVVTVEMKIHTQSQRE